jgi:CheY-like chemotaxis protein
VSVSLPAILTASDRVPSGPPSSMSGAVKRSRVLLVDDEPSLGRALAAALSGEHEVTYVTSGKAAIELLAIDDRFDVVLCDLMMPGVSGVDVWTRVRSSRPDLGDRFVFVTGGAFTAETSAFLDDGKSYLEKPFDMPKLRALLRHRAKRVH